MTLPELKLLIDTLELPVTYLKWAVGQVPELPYIVYYADEDVGFYADDSVFSESYSVTIELYTVNKDIQIENKIKNLLNDNHIPYETYEDYLESEEMFLKAFEIKI